MINYMKNKMKVVLLLCMLCSVHGIATILQRIITPAFLVTIPDTYSIQELLAGLAGETVLVFGFQLLTKNQKVFGTYPACAPWNGAPI